MSSTPWWTRAARALVVGAALGTSPGCATTASANGRAEVDALLATYDRAERESDAAAIERLLARGDALWVFEHGAVNRGFDDFVTNHLRPELAEARGGRTRSVLRRVEIHGETAWVLDQSEREHDQPDGSVRRAMLTTTLVLRRLPEGWRIVHLHWSAHRIRPPAPPAPPPSPAQ